MFKFSVTSRQRLETCHPDLIKIFETAIKMSDVDFGIAEGFRDVERQMKLFKEGKSKIDGIHRKGKHNYNPSHAVDIYAYYENKAQWDSEHLCYISGIIKAVSELLYKENKISHQIRWGGNWDRDGIILKDQSFDDLVHFELI